MLLEIDYNAAEKKKQFGSVTNFLNVLWKDANTCTHMHRKAAHPFYVAIYKRGTHFFFFFLIFVRAQEADRQTRWVVFAH